MNRSFSARHRFDGFFWLAFVLLAGFLVYMGFAGQIALRFTGKADYPAPLALVVHVWSFFAWLSLLAVQVLLRRFGMLRWHRLFGYAAILLIPAMAWSAIAAEAYGQRYYAPVDPEVVRFFPIPIASMAGFVGCASAAILLRHHAAEHKRLIYLATCTVLSATFFRWWGDALSAMLEPDLVVSGWIVNYVGVALLLLTGLLYDLATRGRVHQVYLIAVPLLLAAQWSAVAVGLSQWWPAFGRTILGIPPA